MTHTEVATMIASIGLPYAYYEFPDDTEQEPPFVVFYYPQSDDLYADNQNYVGITQLNIELYTDEKDFDLESTVESVLAGAGLTYTKMETRIDKERMWQILYQMEVIINE